MNGVQLDSEWASTESDSTMYFRESQSTRRDMHPEMHTSSDLRLSLESAESVYALGFSRARRMQLGLFLNELVGRKSLKYRVICKENIENIEDGARILLWGMKTHPALVSLVERKDVCIFRVEDSFIGSGREVLGERVYSLVIDPIGIYTDANHECYIERILANIEFSKADLSRAIDLKHLLNSKAVFKYRNTSYRELNVRGTANNKIILVPGQIDTGWSVRESGKGHNSLSVLQLVRDLNRDAYIIFKLPSLHYRSTPLLLKDNRLKCADKVVSDARIGQCIELADEVHTVTSLAGFEALLRGKAVTTYGTPFYGGWGLTTDYSDFERRKRKVTLDELIYAALVLYPQYYSYLRRSLCSVEDAVLEFANEKRSLLGGLAGFVVSKLARLAVFNMD
jgi:capsular polysaccharide export protein